MGKRAELIGLVAVLLGAAALSLAEHSVVPILCLVFIPLSLLLLFKRWLP